MRMISRIALAITVFYWLHLLRNFSIVYFIGLATLISTILLLRMQRLVSPPRVNIYLLSIFILWVYASAITMTNQSLSHESPLIGLFRLWSIFPLIYVSEILANEPIDQRMRFFVLFYLIAAFTIPLQYKIGPIEWFAEASGRAGADRFASLTGSLTSFGISLGVAGVAALCVLPRSVAAGAFAFLIIGGLLSLQKAAIANIFLAMLLSIWVKQKKLLPTLRYALKIILKILVISLMFILLIGSNELITNMFEIMMRFSLGVFTNDAELTHDVGFFQSIIDRIVDVPSLAISYHDAASLLFGAGVFGAAGALGYPEIPMAHNGIVELVLIFGIPLGVAINLYLLAFIVRLVLKARKSINMELRFLSACAILFYINNIFSGGGFFQPISAFIFWTIYFRVRVINKTTSQISDHNDNSCLTKAI